MLSNQSVEKFGGKDYNQDEMTRKNWLKLLLIGALILLSLGGWMLHFRIHPPAKYLFGYLPFAVGLFSISILPLLFWFRSTAAYAFVINTMLVIIGTIAMAHFSLFHFKGPVTLNSIFFNTLLADIFILWGNLFIGKALFDLELLRSDQEIFPKIDFKRFFRYPNGGWILVHFFNLALVYALGHILWR